MISIKTNISVVSTSLINRLQILRDPRPLLRPVALDVLALMTARIHEDGKAADGSQIGTYSPAYIKIRTGAFGNNKVTKGANKGNKKKGTAGVVSRGENAGAKRKSYNRTGDTKIIVSLTRQLENDWAVKPTDKGWGIGFNNPVNAQKMKWVEKNKDKKIASLTADEKKYAVQKLQQLINKQLNA